MVDPELGPHQGPELRPGGRSGSPTGRDRRRAPRSWPAAAMASEGRRRTPATPSPAVPPSPSRHAGALDSRASLGPTGCARCRRSPVARSGAARPRPAAPGRPHRGGGSAPRRSCPCRRRRRKRHHPPQVRVVGGTEGVHRRSAGHDRRHEGVLAPEYVGHFVVEPLLGRLWPPCPPAGALLPRSPDT